MYHIPEKENEVESFNTKNKIIILWINLDDIYNYFKAEILDLNLLLYFLEWRESYSKKLQVLFSIL